jgi:hypothetical protein
MTTGLLVLASAVLLLESVRRRDGVLIAIGIFLITHFTLRSVILAAGLDLPYPPYLFGSGSSSTPLFHRADLIIVLWIGCLLLGTLAVGDVSPRPETPPEPASPDRPAPTFALAVLTVGTILLLVVHHGGLAGTQRFVRLGDDGSGGTGIFLLAPSALLVVSVAQLRGYDRAVRSSAYVGLLLSVLAFVVLGSRTPVFAVIIALGVGAVIRSRSINGYSLRVLAIPILLAVIVPLLAVSLRNARDANLAEATSQSQAQTGTVGSVSRSINANYYDALALVVRDAGVIYPKRPISDFLTDAQALVPHALWPGKPPFESAGKWLRRQYEPQRINGWPTGAPGDWYLALGMVGVALGAILTVAMGGFLRRKAVGLAPTAPVELAVLWGFLVLPGGLDEQIIARLVVWVLVPLVYVALARPFSLRPETPRQAPRSLRAARKGPG